MALQRIGIIGDPHQEDERLERAITLFTKANVDAIWCVGDIVDGTGSLLRTVNLLRDHNVVCVKGNHERWALSGQMRHLPNANTSLSKDERDFLDSLPETMHFETPAGGVLLCHGVGDDDEAELYPETSGYALAETPIRQLMLDSQVQYMIGGHTHRRMVRPFPGVVVINAGTLRAEKSPGVMIVDFVEMSWRWYRDEAARYVGEIEHDLPLPMPLE